MTEIQPAPAASGAASGRGRSQRGGGGGRRRHGRNHRGSGRPQVSGAGGRQQHQNGEGQPPAAAANGTPAPPLAAAANSDTPAAAGAPRGGGSSGSQRGASGRGGGGGRARGSRRGGGSAAMNNQRAALAAPRAFGGQLTTSQSQGGGSGNGDDEAASTVSLDAGAADFVPGQTSRPAPAPKAAAAKQRPSKSMAPDLPTRIHEDINSGLYECVICTNEVLRNSRIWSCSLCWTVTHMSCVKKWHSNHLKRAEEAARQQQQQQPAAAWRCPGCNSSMTEEPNTYHCWCGKEINPKTIAGISPHSCGQTCSKPRGTCPHPCPLECHAGPCPPCLLMGPSQSCFCGKHTSTKRCGETDYNNGWSCHETCGDLLACGEHECQRSCHPGLCGTCEVPVSSSCYCGQVSSEIPCDERGDQLESFNHGQLKREVTEAERDGLEESWYWGSFDCENPCGRSFDCGRHFCQKACHPQDESQAHCPFSSDVVVNCPCGKTPLAEILESPRQSCEDAIPNCDKICGKPLECGHTCNERCHAGRCSPCTQRMEIGCRCGRTKSMTVCHQGVVSSPECMKICRAQLNCGRHEHGEHCCTGERRAAERVAAAKKRKNKIAAPVSSNEEFEAEHICVRVCGRELKCGKHSCQQMCHRGPCPSCPEAIFDEISCNCGRTVLQPPQPCGTRPPECRFDCTRPRPCGHPQVSHNCHLDDKDCPKCPFLVEKQCICGKQTLKNQPCWFQEPRCGLPCNKRLKCGYHKCRKLCHRDGECEDVGIVGSHCDQPCLKPRQSCDHEDTDRCHAPFACKEDRPCQAKTFITCPCQHKKQEVKCLASETNQFPRRTTLDCDDECLRLQRNARLANALNIDPQSHADDHIPYSDTTLKFFKENVKWSQTFERELRVFATDAAEKRLRLKPMPSHQRAFLHSLAEDFGLDSESSDPEPHRHVCLFKTPKFVSAPMKTLSQCIKIRAAAQDQAVQSQEPPPNPAANQPFNALILSSPRFGLTIEEINTAFRQDFAAHPTVTFHTDFLPSEEVVIKGSGSWTSQTLETALTALKAAIQPKIHRLDLAKGGVLLCHADQSLNILRRENDSSQAKNSSGGWNAVVGRSAARPRTVATPSSSSAAPMRSRFIALRKEPKKQQKADDEPVEEDWEVAAAAAQSGDDGA